MFDEQIAEGKEEAGEIVGGYGGGAYVENGNVIMSGGAVDNNTANTGAGLYLSALENQAKVALKIFSGSVSGNQALEKGGNMPCAMNAANEAAVAAFLKERIGFYDITDVVEECMLSTDFDADPDIDNIFKTNEATLAKAGEIINKISR
jgi:hypothetical protein